MIAKNIPALWLFWNVLAYILFIESYISKND